MTAVVLRCDGPPGLRRRGYRSLARAIDSSRAPTVVAFVTVVGDPRPGYLIAPRELVDALAADPAVPGAWSVTSWPPGYGEPPRGWAARRAISVTTPDRRSPVSAGADAPAPGPRVGAGEWLAVQTLWAGGRGAGVWATHRWWYAAPNREALRARFEAVSTAVAGAWSDASGVAVRPGRLGLGAHRDWLRHGTSSVPARAWVRVGPDRADRLAEPGWIGLPGTEAGRSGHAVVLGASGAGKTCFLADRAADAIRRGGPVVAIDVHGDLAPSIVARLGPAEQARLVCIDLGERPVCGVAAIPPGAAPERAAAHLVAALKRLSPDGQDVYWGFRLERIFDAFVRLVQESGGSLLDLYALLTDADRRDAARLATRSPDLARFLEELGPVVRRTPDFLWAAAARLAKVVAVGPVAELLAPPDGGLPVERLLRGGRSVLVRLPFAQLGPEAAGFAATLALARIYLGVAALDPDARSPEPVTVVLDEVQGLSPRLVAEMLAEGRKFAFRLLVATQYPDRLAPELRAAVTGVVRDFVVFRTPRPSASVAGAWLGLSPGEAERSLADLPAGHGWARGPDEASLRPIVPSELPPPGSAERWSSAVERTRGEFSPLPSDPARRLDGAESERLLLAVLAAEEEGRPLAVEAVAAAAERIPGPAIDAAGVVDRLRPLEREGCLTVGPDGLRLTTAGERRLGLGAPTGAACESAEHRRLILAAFRLFARRGHRLEIVRQGRFDTRLPDALYRQLPERLRTEGPAELARALDRLRGGWAWRFFGGRDVHVEAEVSGALRPERIRRGLAKAAARDAYALFVVSDSHRAARVRATVRRLGAGIDRAQVWTLAAPRGLPPLARERGPGTGAP